MAEISYRRHRSLPIAKLDAEAFDLGWLFFDRRSRHDRGGRTHPVSRAAKEMIKTGGVNVAPLEVEQVLLQHPDIVQAYLVGVSSN
jgi:acyl-coenzyme A synthetase/AMP-(fatty) acid ligase